MKPVAIVQGAIIAACIAVLWSVAANWPYPNALVRPLLPPRIAYPTEQIKEWVESGAFDPAFLKFFARDPERTAPPGDNFVSPADGVVKYIDTRDGITYFVVGLSFWDVHVVRAPVAGIVKDIVIEGVSLYREPGETKDMAFLRGKAAPVQAIITIGTPRGDIKVRMITSWWASRLKVSAVIGQRLEKGERIGRILAGSSASVDFPWPQRFEVEPRERVVAGETIIAAPPAAVPMPASEGAVQ